MPDDATLLAAVKSVVDPALGRSLGELGMVKSVESTDGTTKIGVELPTPAYPARAALEEEIRRTLADRGDAQPMHLSFTTTVKGKNAGGAIGLTVRNVIAVGSGKGGVGKSTVAATLAYGLQELGCKTGLLDADVYGPSVPHLVGVNQQPVALNKETPEGQTIMRIQPVPAHGLPTISMGYFVKADQAVIWRGPMLHQAISQFLQQVDWGDLDYLIIDMPPGTGDVSLTLSQMVSLAGAVVVCTPQQVALLDAVKAVSMFRQVKIPVLGMVENMAGDIFGRGGAKAKAADLGIPCLGEVPLDATIRVQGDAGEIASLVKEGSPVRQQLLDICSNVAIEVAKTVLSGPALPTLEIL